MALNLDAALEQLYRGEILAEETVKEVCERIKESLIYQPNVQPIRAPVTVVGNLHGYVPIVAYMVQIWHFDTTLSPFAFLSTSWGLLLLRSRFSS